LETYHQTAFTTAVPVILTEQATNGTKSLSFCPTSCMYGHNYCADTVIWGTNQVAHNQQGDTFWTTGRHVWTINYDLCINSLRSSGMSTNAHW